jgi:beta-glucosidase
VDYVAHAQVAREIAEQGIVLLKNEDEFLPLDPKEIRSIALIGAEWFAGMAKLPPRSIRADNVSVVAPFTITPRQGLEHVLMTLGSPATVTYESAGGTGTKEDREEALELARESDVVIVMVGDNPHELCDRETLSLPVIPPADPNFCAYDELEEGEYDLPRPERGEGTHQEMLMAELTADPELAQKTVVVLKTEGMVLMPWLDKVPALVEAWYPGQSDGLAVANVLFGLRNPSGKLPMTFGNSEREAAHATTAQFPGLWVDPPHWLARPAESDEPGGDPSPTLEGQKRFSAQYTEGLQMGYRWYEANDVEPVFPFGFGLSYTTFTYTELSVQPSVGPQGQSLLTVRYRITNTGARQGAEASQVYLTLPPEAGQPSKRLVGFQKVDLLPGTSREVTVTIDEAASNHPLSYWVPENDAPEPGWGRGEWRTAPGDYTVHVGTSSADTPLQQTISLGAGAPSASPAAGAPSSAGMLAGRR